MPELLATIHNPRQPGVKGRRMLAVLHETTLRRILARTLDEFLGPRGLRAASRYHGDHRFRFDVHGSDVRGGLLAIRLRVVRRQLERARSVRCGSPVDDLVLRGLLHLYASTAMTSPHGARPAQDARCT